LLQENHPLSSPRQRFAAESIREILAAGATHQGLDAVKPDSRGIGGATTPQQQDARQQRDADCEYAVVGSTRLSA
jgi:hypothetical protein